ncbi:MAG: NACHT domain-containing protein [Saprospiraceae bacterium]|nr:NACHT domain-containing protein [Saprospiraceae bacterium]
MFSFLSNLSDRAKLLVAVLVISIASVSAFLLFSNRINAGIIGAVIGFILLVSHPVWLPESKTRIRLASLALAGAAVLTTSIWPNLLVEIVRYFSPETATQLATTLASATSIPVLVFILIAIFLVNYFSRDTTAMGKHDTAIDKDIPDPTFKEKMRGVVEALVDDLKSIDNKTNWSMSYFTPLDAEVEVNTGRGREKRITELLSAIKRSKERLFMVLGDPGSGKSVALRKLARDLAAESEKTGKIPVYINLKEWYVEEKWTEEQPPTVEQLNAFVLRNLKNRDIVTTRFFDKYYDRLYETGRLYFIFDSFDEIPSVLDERDGSFLIHRLSEIIFRFLKGARLESQGVLASRIYRKPTNEFQSNVTLEIRPFSEEKIIQTLKRSNIYSKELAERLFKERPELVPIAKNPFMATLVADFAENNQNRLPANQAEMYRSYIEKTLNDCSDRLERKNIDKATVYTCCDVLAREMFEVYGLEAPIDKIRKKYPELPLEEVTDILRFARLGRGVSNDVSKFSFVHRRFAEYFFVQSMLMGEVNIQPDSIPTDSQQRDALVLYCEVAEFEKAKSIADYCWSVIAEVNNPMDLRSIHCLRFLRDAFRGRKECIAGFQDALKVYIGEQLTEDSNLVSAKLATEAIGLMDKEGMENLLVQSIKLNNSWISECAVKSCWHLDNLNVVTKKNLFLYFNSVPILDVLKHYNEYKFFLSLSNSFFVFLTFYQIKLTRFILIILFILSSSILYPGLLVTSVVLFIMLLINKIHRKYGKWYIRRNNYGLKRSFFDDSLSVFSISISLISIALLSLKSAINLKLLPEPSTFTTSDLHPNTYLILIIFIFSTSHHELYLHFKLKSLIEAINLGTKNSQIFTRYQSKEFIYTLLTLVIFVLVAVFMNNILPKKISSVLGSSFLILMSVLIAAGLIYSFINEIKEYKKQREYLKKTTNNTSRWQIFSAITTLSEKYKIRYIEHLESKVKTVTGEWPDPLFLSDKNSEVITRLAKLEEKWLGLDR